MAGGTWDKLTGKTRPGTYINFESQRRDTIPINTRGTVLLPLLGHDYGPAGEYITLTCSSPDAQRAKLGYSVYDTNPAMQHIREAFKKASIVKVYIPRQGSAASGVSENLTGTAEYGGERGNELSFSVVANPSGGFDVAKFLDGEKLGGVEGITTIEELISEDTGEWIKFSGSGDLKATAGVKLSSGTAATPTAADMTKFLDSSEAETWNTMAWPLAPTEEEGDPVPALMEALRTKISYLRDSVGKKRTAVVANYAADYEGIINVTNGVVLSDGTTLNAAEAVFWVAGATAAAGNTTSLTCVEYNGATAVSAPKSNEEAEAAIKAGEFFFSMSEEGKVVVEYDINSLVTFTNQKTKDYCKNRVMRVYDSYAEWCTLNFPPNKFDNSPDGWDTMEGIGRSGLQQFLDDGAIKNVDKDSDFLVNRESSEGDETYFIVGLQAVDSAEKMFFTVKTK